MPSKPPNDYTRCTPPTHALLRGVLQQHYFQRGDHATAPEVDASVKAELHAHAKRLHPLPLLAALIKAGRHHDSLQTPVHDIVGTRTDTVRSDPGGTSHHVS